jgi:hypothetical protein
MNIAFFEKILKVTNSQTSDLYVYKKKQKKPSQCDLDSTRSR